jgi:hypothetical protein
LRTGIKNGGRKAFGLTPRALDSRVLDCVGNAFGAKDVIFYTTARILLAALFARRFLTS